ncbi:MAG TPA: polyhydroxyalkanoic acid system family protein [Telluria sp.]
MADISIVQEHGLNHEMARAAAQTVADKMAADYGLVLSWEGDVLRFERVGVNGALTLEAQRAVMRIELGFPMGMMAAAIEAKVADKMRRVFGA